MTQPRRPSRPPARPPHPRGTKPAYLRADSELAAPPPNAERPWLLLRNAGQHPLIYARMVRAVDPQARPGDVVTVYDRDRRRFGQGLYNPASQIALRMLTYGSASADETFWSDKLSQAIALRRDLRLDEITDAYRLVHAEGDGLSGLIAERYADCLVFEVFSLGVFQRIERIAAELIRQLGPPRRLDRPDGAADAWRVIVRADRDIARLEGFQPPSNENSSSELIIREHGIRYAIDPAGGHKTGFFCDQRENRRRLADFCRDATVLDLCCYSGGFGLAARLLGGAREVTSVDLDEGALALARRNANLNQARIHHAQEDVFIYLRQMIQDRRTFDVVVLDPPKFAPSRAAYEDALRKYHDLNKLGCQVVRPGGLLLTCSCSGLVSETAFMDAVHSAARVSRRRLQIIARTGAGGDHPVMADCPESGYLKALWLRVLAN